MERADFESVVVDHSTFVRDCLVRLEVPTCDLPDVEQQVWLAVWRQVQWKYHALSKTSIDGVRTRLFQACEAQATAYLHTCSRQEDAEGQWAARNWEHVRFPDPEEHLHARRDRQLARDLAGRLEPARRKVITVYVESGRAMGYVARRLRIPESTAYNRLRLAYADLRAAGRRLTASQEWATWAEPKPPTTGDIGASRTSSTGQFETGLPVKRSDENMAKEPSQTRQGSTPVDPLEAPEFAALRELRRRLSRGGLPGQRTPEDDARLAAFATLQELLLVLGEFRVRVRRGDAVRLRVLEQQSTPARMRLEVVIEPTGRQGSP